MRPALGRPQVRTSTGKDVCMRKQSAHYTEYYLFEDEKNERGDSAPPLPCMRMHSFSFTSRDGDVTPPAASRRQSHIEGSHRGAGCRKGRQRMRRATWGKSRATRLLLRMRS